MARNRYTMDPYSWGACTLAATGGWVHATGGRLTACGRHPPDNWTVPTYGTRLDRSWSHDLDYPCAACWAAILAIQQEEIAAGRWRGKRAVNLGDGWVIT